MLPEEFIERKRHAWERLETLIKRAQHNLASLSAEELQEFGRLYRQSTSDLAIARRDFPRHQVSDYLNGLVGRGHSQIYRGKSSRITQVKDFFTTTFPQVVRETGGYTLASFLMFLIPALLGFVIAFRDPAAVSVVISGFEHILDDIENQHEWWNRINDEGRAESSSAIMTNNIQVTFLAFAGGITFGALTLYVLAMNGFLLGSVAGAAQRFDFAANLWGFVAAHGVVELSVIFLAGGAGLQLGWSLLRPGLLTRRAALVIASRRAISILFGCVPLLILAGIIEGFISPSNLPLFIKLFVAVGSGVALASYLLLAGRSSTHNDNPAPH